MADILIRDVPGIIHDWLKERAKSDGVSMNTAALDVLMGEMLRDELRADAGQVEPLTVAERDLMVLAWVADHPGTTAFEIARGVRRANVDRAMKRLEEAGKVASERGVSPDTGRPRVTWTAVKTGLDGLPFRPGPTR